MEDKNHRFAWEWTRGVCTDMETGAPIGRLHVFNTWQERDQWVKDGAHIPRTCSGHREGLSGAQGNRWKKYDADPVVHP